MSETNIDFNTAEILEKEVKALIRSAATKLRRKLLKNSTTSLKGRLHHLGVATKRFFTRRTGHSFAYNRLVDEGEVKICCRSHVCVCVKVLVSMILTFIFLPADE